MILLTFDTTREACLNICMFCQFLAGAAAIWRGPTALDILSHLFDVIFARKSHAGRLDATKIANSRWKRILIYRRATDLDSELTYVFCDSKSWTNISWWELAYSCPKLWLQNNFEWACLLTLSVERLEGLSNGWIESLRKGLQFGKLCIQSKKAARLFADVSLAWVVSSKRRGTPQHEDSQQFLEKHFQDMFRAFGRKAQKNPPWFWKSLKLVTSVWEASKSKHSSPFSYICLSVECFSCDGCQDVHVLFQNFRKACPDLTPTLTVFLPEKPMKTTSFAKRWASRREWNWRYFRLWALISVCRDLGVLNSTWKHHEQGRIIRLKYTYSKVFCICHSLIVSPSFSILQKSWLSKDQNILLVRILGFSTMAEITQSWGLAFELS